MFRSFNQRIFAVFLYATLILFVSVNAQAKKAVKYPGPFEAEVYYIVDGDNIFVRVRLWPGIFTDVNLRLNGVDTPETWHPKCESERTRGKEAADFLMNLLGSPYKTAVLGQPMAVVVLRNVKLGKYAGRALADVSFNDLELSQAIISAGKGRPYSGGKREGWC